MYKLEMKTPLRDVLRLLAGRLTLDDAKQQDWLNRGREPFTEIWQKKGTEIPGVDEQIFATTDSTPDAVRAAAYRVEARRSLLRALDDFVVYFFLAALLAASIVSAVLSVWWTVGLAVGALAVSASLRYRGIGQAIEVVPWRQGLEPLAWALYYPTQIAQRVLDAREELRAAPNKTLRSTLDEMETEIERGPDGVALPGQESEVQNLAVFVNVTYPLLAASIDASRLMATMLSDRAKIAAQLVSGGLRREIGGPTARSQAEALGDRVYSYLLNESSSFATLPRPQAPGLDTSQGTIAEDPSVASLTVKSKELLEAAIRAAGGEWPTEAATRWERPKNRELRIAVVVVGAVLAAVGTYLLTLGDEERVGGVLVTMGAGLIPAPLGGLIKEAAHLPSPATATSMPPPSPAT